MSDEETWGDYVTIKRHERISAGVRYHGVNRGKPFAIDQIQGTVILDGVEQTSYELFSGAGHSASPAAIAAVETYGFRDDELMTEEASER